MSGAYRGVQARVRMLYPLRNIYVLLQSCAKFSGLWRIATPFYSKCDGCCGKRTCLFRDLRSVQLFCESSSKRTPTSSRKSKVISL